MTVLATESSRPLPNLGGGASRLLAGIASLSGLERSVFRLRYILHLPVSTITQRMGISGEELDRLDRKIIRTLRGGENG